MKDYDIRTSDELLEWSKEVNAELRMLVALRARLRLVPQMAFGSWRGEDRTAALMVLRSALRSVVLNFNPPYRNSESSIERVASELRGIELAMGSHSAMAASHAAASAAHAADGSAARAATSAAEAAGSAATADQLRISLANYLEAISADQRSFADTFDIHQAVGQKLWNGDPEEWACYVYWELLSQELFRADETWEFWARWYRGLLEGRPLRWDLQEAVGLIPDDEWRKGPEHIAHLIAEIEARFDLEMRIRELERELAAASRNRLGIGGNNPPEPIDGAPSIAREFTIVWAPLDDLKKDLDAENPDSARVRRALDSLVVALKRGLAWCASKGDLAVDTAIKWAVPAAGGGYLALNPEKIGAVIEAARHWLVFLP